ncbi:hypothetical protein ACHAWO_001227 [Cyclotella atomus]|uniref:FAD/NAD(P)-binding domain-containing protein n=1 Tax=Cyclotella atomus TaxID=382360 RepID=A0ABD3P8X4_9STRA
MTKLVLLHHLIPLTVLVLVVATHRSAFSFSVHSLIPSSSRSRTSSSLCLSSHSPKHLLVVGGGIAGLSSAYDARHLLNPNDRITLLSDRPTFQFTPSNPWVAIGSRSERDISVDLREVLPRHGVDFVPGRAVKLFPQENRVELQSGDALTYDYLMIATGPRLAFEEVPGLDPHITGSSVCTTSHAVDAKEKIDRLVTNPGPIVVGAAEGASCFGPAYEFALLLHSELKKRGGTKLVDACPMTFVTAEPYIGHLGLGGAGESRIILEDLLKERSIDFHTNCRVTSVAKDSISIEVVKEEESNTTTTTTTQHILPSKLTMIIPPFRGHDVWKSTPDLTDKNGLIVVNEYQQSPLYPRIFSAGVCVSIPPVERTLVATGPPKTGYMIESQGTAAIKNIRQMMDYYDSHPEEGQDPLATSPELSSKPLLNGLCITDFGDDGAVFLTLPQYHPRKKDVTLHGRLATLAKVAFEKYFLFKVENGDTDPYYERYMLHLIGVDRVKVAERERKEIEDGRNIVP